MKSIHLKARAKINLTLDITGKLPNGYHLLETIMQTVFLWDDLYIKKIPGSAIKLKTNLPWLPTDQKNLVYKAVDHMKERYGIKDGLFIELKKRIPVGAGLGGGSSDCASAIYGINKIFDLGLSESEMLALCRIFGTDIPFCFKRGTSFATGLGDILTPLEPPPNFFVVLAKPPISISTAFVYKNLVLSDIINHPNNPEMIKSIKEKNYIKICQNLGNVLETVTIPRFPQINRIKNQLESLNADGISMSGSGPTVYGLFSCIQDAKNAAFALKRSGLKEVYVTKIFKA